MRDNDRIDRVLRELGTGEAPQGMNRRITLALEDRLTARADSRAVAWRPMRLLLGGVGALCVLALVVTPTLLRRMDVATRTEPPVVALAAPVPAAPGVQKLLPRGPHFALAYRADRPKRTATTTRRQSNASKGKMELADATYAPTLVSPPMPLTEQERLLLRVVHGGGTEQRAMLDARVRDAELVAEKAAFEAFFKPPELPKEAQ